MCVYEYEQLVNVFVVDMFACLSYGNWKLTSGVHP